MHRIDTDASTVDSKFTDGDPGTGAQATVLGAKWLNNVQEELCNVIEDAGLTLSDAADNQLLLALRRLVAPQPGDFWITTNPTAPATYWGVGTWSKRTGALYGQADGDSQFSTLGAVGGLGDVSLAFTTIAVSTSGGGGSSMAVNDITNPHNHGVPRGRVVYMWERTS